MTLNNDAGKQKVLLDTSFRLAQGREIQKELVASLPSDLRAVSQAFAAGNHGEIVSQLLEGPSALDDMVWYLRLESATSLLFKKGITAAEFIKIISRPDIPPYLYDYYYGIVKYRTGKVAKSFEHFAKARVALEEMVVKYGRFIDGSIRGIVSARSFEEFEKIAENASDIASDNRFPYHLDTPSSSHKRCHIVGCDPKYWEKYSSLFIIWAESLSHKSDVWINCTNFNKIMIEDVRRRAPFIKVSIDYNNFHNAISYYTMTRFILAEKLARRENYESIVCSDIDIWLNIEDYYTLIDDASAGLSGIYKRSRFPWRSSAAVFTIWKGKQARILLRWMTAYFCDVYRPDIKGNNRQWWIDQFILSLFAEIAAGSYRQWGLQPVLFTRLNRLHIPMVLPGQPGGLNKEQFVHYYVSQHS